MRASTANNLRTCAEQVAAVLARRDRYIRRAVAEGGSLREVGAAAGLSHTQVANIVKKEATR